ncbi:Thioredoxin domain-containing protein 3 [Mactra antiquata]
MAEKGGGGTMARKGKEIQLQQEIETQEEWEDMLAKEGLCVIDVYQEWCGPVSAMLGNFRKLKNELGDNLLKFVIAKADTIDALEKYRGRCEPCFLFYAGGVMVAVVRGANAPLILRTITEQLAQEHKVLEGQAERKEIKDTRIAELEQMDKEADNEEEVEEPVKEVSVVIIKPDAVQSGKCDEILDEMKKRGIEILRQEERQLTDEEVKNVYIHLQDEPFFEELVAFMTSSPSIVLAITKGKTGENVIKEFRDLIGPTEVEEAKEQAPESLRAKFGQEKYMNAVHGSDSSDTAARELAFFFPDFVAPKVEGQAKLQRTLALIRPDAYKKNKDEILAKIKESGFKVAMSKEIHLTKEQAEDFYSEHRGQEYFEELTDRMSCGPLLALGLAREEAISGWRDLLGPTKVEEAKEQKPDCLRAQFSEEGAQINMLHGSDSESAAQKEIEYFFPVEQTVAVIKPDAIGTKDEIIEKIHEAGFRIAARKETTLSKEIAEEFYADHKDKEYYNDLVEHMTSGPTYFMVLSREGAVDGWRSMIGPKDPAQAKEVDPQTEVPLRGLFGTDTLRNAVHGSSNPDHAKSTIAKIFGELYFNKDGTLREEDEETDEDGTRTDAKSPVQEEVNKDKEDDKPETGEQQQQEQVNDDESKDKNDDNNDTEKSQEQQQQQQQQQEPQQTEQAEEQTPSQPAESEQQQQQQQEETKEEDKPKSPEPAPEAKPEETTQSEQQEEQKPSTTEEPPQQKEEEEPKVEEQKPAEEPKAEETQQTQQTEETPKADDAPKAEEETQQKAEENKEGEQQQQKEEEKKDDKPAGGAD